MAFALAVGPSCGRTIPEDCTEPPGAWVAALQDTYFIPIYRDTPITSSGYREAPGYSFEPRWYVALEFEGNEGQVPAFGTLSRPIGATLGEIWAANAASREISILGEGDSASRGEDIAGAANAIQCAVGVGIGD
jgi:hypothetical protein